MCRVFGQVEFQLGVLVGKSDRQESEPLEIFGGDTVIILIAIVHRKPLPGSHSRFKIIKVVNRPWRGVNDTNLTMESLGQGTIETDIFAGAGGVTYAIVS